MGSHALSLERTEGGWGKIFLSGRANAVGHKSSQYEEEKWSTVTADLPDHKSGAEEEAIWARLRFYNCPRMCVSEVLYDHALPEILRLDFESL